MATRLDRVFRAAEDCLQVTGQWQRQGVALHLIDLGGQAVDTTSPFGEFLLVVMAAVAQMERATVRERTRAVMRHKKANGAWTGGCVPYGYDVDGRGKLVKRPDGQAVIATMRELRDAGESLRAIADILRATGKKARGKKWHAMTVSRVLSRPI